jgi:NTP pyrophosphatase (non-canonical NTP hydrolase)
MVESDNLSKIQNRIDKWIKEHGGYWSPLAMFTSIIEECGELGREINYLEGFKPKKPTEKESNLGEELADLLFSVICLANHYKIDLGEKLNQVLEKYTTRDAHRFK